jgi:hypothetical protein
LQGALRPKYEQHVAYSDAKKDVPASFLTDQDETQDFGIKPFRGVEIVRVNRGFYHRFDGRRLSYGICSIH